MSKPNKTIFVTFQQEGTHHYPEALTDQSLESVSFLGHPHRHMFHFKVWIEITHKNRDIEFLIFKRELQSVLGTGHLELNNLSCEMISDNIATYLQSKYPGRYIAVEVSEDLENGSYCEYPVIKTHELHG